MYQYERYKQVLGDDAPKSWREFRSIKRAGDEEWEKLRSHYTSANKNGIINQDENARIDIVIDSFTPCLVDRETGHVIDTKTVKIIPKKADYKGWNFDWSIPQRNGYDVTQPRFARRREALIE